MSGEREGEGGRGKRRGKAEGEREGGGGRGEGGKGGDKRRGGSETLNGGSTIVQRSMYLVLVLVRKD